MTDIGIKEKILNHAHDLFSEKGYNGTSVRDIANAADVNIASINYHFQNKENLFRETVQSCLSSMALKVREIYEDNKSIDIEELSLKIFDYFTKNSKDLKTAFKIIVIDSDVIPLMPERDDEVIGPPGGKVLFDCIQNQKPDASEDDLIWAVRTIYTMIIHKALIYNSCCLDKEKAHKVDFDDFNGLLSRHARVILADI